MTEDRTQKDLLTLVLEMARKKIAEPARWTKGALARMAVSIGLDPLLLHGLQGIKTSPNSAYACCWCAEGAIRWAVANYKRDEPDDYGEHALDSHEQRMLIEDAYIAFFHGAVRAGVPYAVLWHAAHPLNRLDPCEINDRADTTHAHVIAAFDEAIRELG